MPEISEWFLYTKVKSLPSLVSGLEINLYPNFGIVWILFLPESPNISRNAWMICVMHGLET